MHSTGSEFEMQSTILKRLLYCMACLQVVVAFVLWFEFQKLSRFLDVAALHHSFAPHAGTQAALFTIQHLLLIVKAAIVAIPFFVVISALCVLQLRRQTSWHISRREEMEAELRKERSVLEERIETRTAELQSEITERKHAEHQNVGRNRILEMLTREVPAREVLQAIVEVAAADHSSWGCALHLVHDGQLRMEAFAGLPPKLAAKLQQLTTEMADTPEATVMKELNPLILEDLSRERSPWPQLLHAYGIQSLWSEPVVTPDGRSKGTITIYSLLRCTPSERDWKLLDSHSQMASMVLERYHLQDELRRHAFHDSLTGLPNRLLGERQLSASISRGQRSGNQVAVLWIDLNKFKQTNDVYGHVAGDAVLKEVSTRLSQRFRENDTIARMGGDEFMAVLEGVADRATAEAIASELVYELGMPISFHGVILNISASVGISLYPEHGDTADLLQRNADLAMYEAKFGNHACRTFSPALDSSLKERREIETALIHALEHGGFALHYQPVYGLDGSLASLEALLRFPHPEMGMISPARLIPIAEKSQLIVPIGSWVLREACRQNVAWQSAGYCSVPIAVNISAVHFAQFGFANEVAEILKETNLPPHLLHLELTESVMVQDFEECKRQLQRLRSLGVKVALDDFGTGYSSLNSLHHLAIDHLKIDRSFIQALNEANGTTAIVEGIISMAHCLGMHVIAEGVETAEQQQMLKLKGCDYLQGYLFSKPVNADTVPDLLATSPKEAALPQYSYVLHGHIDTMELAHS